MEEARNKKTEEKGRREGRAKDMGIDLTTSGGQRGGSWVASKQESNLLTSPKSARAIIPPRTTPRLTAPPPNSARGPGERQDKAVAVKVSTNVLMVTGFKRQNGNAKKKDARPKDSNNNNNTSKSKNTTPNLNNNNPNKEPGRCPKGCH